jgi:hypothetical protein
MANRYDERSRRIIQVVLNTGERGPFGAAAAQKIADVQESQGLRVNGQMNEQSLAPLVHHLLEIKSSPYAIHLACDLHNVDLSSGAVSVRYDESLGWFRLAETSFEGGLRVIRVGPLAFATPGALANTIQAELAVPVPPQAEVPRGPSRLTDQEVEAALDSNRSQVNDVRSVLAIRAATGAPLTGAMDVDLVQRIANLQHAKTLARRWVSGRPDHRRGGGRAEGRRSLQLRHPADHRLLRFAGL